MRRPPEGADEASLPAAADEGYVPNALTGWAVCPEDAERLGSEACVT